MSEVQRPTREAGKDKSRAAIIRDYLIGGSREFDTYRDPELYDKGAYSRLYRRDNLARGVADVALAHFPLEQDNTNILDIGAGTGILSMELAGRHHTVTALDLFKPQLMRLREKAAAADLAQNILPVQADMNKGLPFADDSFGAVVSLRATRYVDNFDSWLDEIHRVLEPGGSFVLPVFAVDTIPWKRNANEGVHQPTTHHNVKAAILDAGFEINEAASIGYSKAVDLSLGERDVPFYYKPNFVVAKASA